MKDVFLVYDKICVYEIVILNYFMSFSNCDMVFCSLDGKPVCAMEGFSVNVDLSLEALDKGQIRSFILPGRDISEITECNGKEFEAIWTFVRKFCFGWIDKFYSLMYNLNYT